VSGSVSFRNDRAMLESGNKTYGGTSNGLTRARVGGGGGPNLGAQEEEESSQALRQQYLTRTGWLWKSEGRSENKNRFNSREESADARKAEAGAGKNDFQGTFRRTFGVGNLAKTPLHGEVTSNQRGKKRSSWRGRLFSKRGGRQEGGSKESKTVKRGGGNRRPEKRKKNQGIRRSSGIGQESEKKEEKVGKITAGGRKGGKRSRPGHWRDEP